MSIYQPQAQSLNRASIVPLGFVLVVGVITLALAAFQVTTVPVINNDAELENAQVIQTDMQNFNQQIIQSSVTGVPRPFIFNNVVDYPFQIVEPPQPTTLIQTRSPMTFSVSGSEPVSLGEGQEWSSQREAFTTRPFEVFTPYTYNTDAPRVQSEYGVVNLAPPNEPLNTQATVSNQLLITDNSISVYVIDNQVSSIRQSNAAIQITPRPSKSIDIELTHASASTPIEFEFETTLSESVWTDMLESEGVENGGYIERIEFEEEQDPRYDRVTLVMSPEEEYRLQIYYVELDVQSGIRP